MVEGTCSEQGGTICSISHTCSASWIDASDSDRCCSGEDNIYAYKFMKKNNSKPVCIVWWQYEDDKYYNRGDKKIFTLNTCNVNSVKITEAVPDAESGAELNENDSTLTSLYQR